MESSVNLIENWDRIYSGLCLEHWYPNPRERSVLGETRLNLKPFPETSYLISGRNWIKVFFIER